MNINNVDKKERDDVLMQEDKCKICKYKKEAEHQFPNLCSAST